MSEFTIEEAARVVVYRDEKHGYAIALFGGGLEEELKALKLEQETGGVMIHAGHPDAYVLVTRRSNE